MCSLIRILFVSLIFLFKVISAEEVAKFQYPAAPENLAGKNLVLPTGTVAMSEYVYVSNLPPNTIKISGKSSVVFVIDNSASMKNSSKDQGGSRYTVTKAFIDSIYKLSPQSEVGLVVFGTALWFLPKDDSLFKPVTTPTGLEGGYIPLLTLDSVYAKFGNMTGVQLLRKWLKTDSVGSGSSAYIDLTYRKGSNDDVRQTNINAGFHGVRDAMKTAKNPKERQFVIFLSDGEANKAISGENEKDYIKGKNVPTTFTVYFTKDSNDVDYKDIKAMTDSIKVNGYSLSNPQSNLWSIKTDHDALLKLLMDNVINKIIQFNFTYTPKKLMVNGISPISDWDKKGFAFAKVFPLIGAATPFKFDITYQIGKDSISSNNDTISIVLRDTSYSFSFTVNVQDNAAIPAPVKLFKWDRFMSFLDNGTAISSANDMMKKLDIRFTEKQVDVLYGYTDVAVTMTHAQDNPADIEKYSLSQTGVGTHGVTFPRQLGKPVSGDGILQHSSSGEILAIYRNPYLPLDTLRKSLPFNEIPVTLKSGIYFDNNADGYVDSIYIGISYENTDSIAERIVMAIANLFPPHRAFRLCSVSSLKSGIGITVAEQAADIRTFTDDKDKLEVANKLPISGNLQLYPCTIRFIDSVAPVIMRADYYDTTTIQGGDTVDVKRGLNVQLSENLREITGHKSFRYYTPSGKKEYMATLNKISQTDKHTIFSVMSFDGSDNIREKDSIRINTEIQENVGDVVGNRQGNPLNIRREIFVHHAIVKKAKPFLLVLKTTILEPNKAISIDQEIAGVKAIGDMLDKLSPEQKKGNAYTGISLIVCEPSNKLSPVEADSCSATITLYDAVGNVVLSDVQMAYYAKDKVFNKLIYIWPGTNSRARSTGSGVYAVVVRAKLYFDHAQQPYKEQILKGFVGVKRN